MYCISSKDYLRPTSTVPRAGTKLCWVKQHHHRSAMRVYIIIIIKYTSAGCAVKFRKKANYICSKCGYWHYVHHIIHGKSCINVKYLYTWRNLWKNKYYILKSFYCHHDSSTPFVVWVYVCALLPFQLLLLRTVRGMQIIF